MLLGNGDGTFRSGINSPTSREANVIAAGDFDGDGRTDLAVGLYGMGVVILLGNGDGSFRESGSYAIAGSVSDIAVADFNRDGRADLAALDYSTGTLKILLGNGDGTFQPPVTYDTGGQTPGSLVIADFNADGVPDVALTHGAYTTTTTVSVFIANPDGTLQAVRNIGIGTIDTPSIVVAGDFNGDGKPDLVAVGSWSWTVLIGNGDGTFQQRSTTSYMSGTFSAVPGDFNGDGKLDVALIADINGSEGILFLFGQGDGTFQPPVAYAGSVYYLIPVGAGEFTGGGKADIALIDRVNNAAQLLRDPVAGLGISSTHVSSLWQGLVGASYVLTVINNQTTAFAGAITVTDTLPAGLTATAISGSGWVCVLATLTCTRSDSLPPGNSYPPDRSDVRHSHKRPCTGDQLGRAFRRRSDFGHR